MDCMQKENQEDLVMKKAVTRLMALVMGIAMAFTFSACSNSNTEPSAEPTQSSLQTPSGNSQRSVNENAKALVVYFSVPDNQDNSYVEINGERLGNTQYMAYVIQENTGADIFRILPKNPYPTDHDALLEVAQEEIRTNARPEIEGTIEDFDSYDVVFVGYPNWDADMPYILYTFFESYDFAGKTIIPFNTHGGSGFSGTQETIAELEPNEPCWRGRAFQETVLKVQNRKLSTGWTAFVC